MAAAPEPTLGELREPALDEVEPGVVASHHRRHDDEGTGRGHVQADLRLRTLAPHPQVPHETHLEIRAE